MMGSTERVTYMPVISRPDAAHALTHHGGRFDARLRPNSGTANFARYVSA